MKSLLGELLDEDPGEGVSQVLDKISGGQSTSYSIGNIQGLVRPLKRR